MNPLPLLLLLLATNGGVGNLGGGLGKALSSLGISSNQPLQLDNLLNQMQTAMSTLEKVNQLSQIGSGGSSFSLPAPSVNPTPPPMESYSSPPPPTEPAPSSPSPLPNIDLQSAMQSLGPILSMLGGNQPSK